MSTVYHFSIPTMSCESCVGALRSALNANKEIRIESIAADTLAQTIDVTVAAGHAFTPEETSDKLRAIMADTGATCIPKGRVDELKHVIRDHLIKGILGAVLGVILMALMLSGVGIPLLVMYGLVALSTSLTFFLGADSYYQTYKNLVGSKTLVMDSLFTVSTLTVIGVSIASFFFPFLPMMMEGGLMIFGFRHIGNAIKTSLKKKMAQGLKFRNRAPLHISKIEKEGSIAAQERCLVASLEIGDTIIVRRGETVPVDGECLDQSTFLDDSIVSGCPFQFGRYERGDKILAGMKVPADIDFITMKVTQIEAASFLARRDERIAKASDEKENEKTSIEKTANKILQYFIPGVIGLAILSGIVVGILFNPALAIQCAAAILVSACPCTLGAITPLSIKIGMTKAQENGVVFKSGKALEEAADINTVVFDLNGTLTAGVPRVSRVKISPLISHHDFSNFFDYLSLIETQSSHLIAQSIVKFINKKKLSRHPSWTVTDVDKTHHAGIEATIDGVRFAVGNEDMMSAKGIDISAFANEINQEKAPHVVYLAKGNVVLGYILLQDPLREDAAYTIQTLRQSGKEVHICTGANQRTAAYYAKALDIPLKHVYANCKKDDGIESKLHHIKFLKEAGKKVAMVGDAGNDSLAIAGSHFGIAVQSQASDEMTRQEAGALIHDTSLLPVVTAFAVAKQTARNIKKNLLMSLGYNSLILLAASGVFIGVGFMINPGIGVALMVLQTCCLLAYQYYQSKKPLAHLQPANKPSLQNEHDGGTTYGRFQKQGLTENKRCHRQSRAHDMSRAINQAAYHRPLLGKPLTMPGNQLGPNSERGRRPHSRML